VAQQIEPELQRVGARGARSVLAEIGVLQQTLLNDACTAIASGKEDIALVTGGDAKYRSVRAQHAGLEIHSTSQTGVQPDVTLTPSEPLWSEVEAARGLMMPAQFFSVMESAIRYDGGLSVDAHRDRIAGLVSVAAGSGYWRDNAPQLKRIVLYFWHVLVPVGVAIAGYFPGKRIGKVGDLPRGVVLQWRRWCMHPRYHVGAEGEAVRQRFAGARFPIVALSITDDELMTERGTRVLIDCFENAPRQLQRIAPADVGAQRIGHFGFFRRQFESTLWRRLENLLAGFGPHAGTTAP